MWEMAAERPTKGIGWMEGRKKQRDSIGHGEAKDAGENGPCPDWGRGGGQGRLCTRSKKLEPVTARPRCESVGVKAP